jgi:hypothetical protein
MRLDLQDQSAPITANCVPVAPPQVLTIATGLSSTIHTLTIRTTPDAALAVFDGLVCVPFLPFFIVLHFSLKIISSYTSVQAQGDEPTLTSADIPMSSSSTAPTTTASPAPTPSSSDHTKLIAGIVPSILALVGAFLAYLKRHQIRARLGCCGTAVEISVDDDTPTDDQDAPTRPGRKRSGSSSRRSVTSQA